jgi:hypothetical protein
LYSRNRKTADRNSKNDSSNSNDASNSKDASKIRNPSKSWVASNSKDATADMPFAARTPTKTRRPAETFFGAKKDLEHRGFLYFSFTQNWSKLGILFQIDVYIIEMKKKS